MLVFALIGCGVPREPEFDVIELEYNGHEYVIFNAVGGNGMGVLHSPDCKCLTKLR